MNKDWIPVYTGMTKRKTRMTKKGRDDVQIFPGERRLPEPGWPVATPRKSSKLDHYIRCGERNL